MNVVFMGTPDFAVDALKSIYNSGHKILAVVTQPDKPVGRKAIITPCAVKVEAQNLGLKVFTYNKIKNEGVEDLKNLNPDVIVTCAYGQILSQEILDIAKFGVVNIHASLLPKYRGSSPIQWAVINGETKTGVTIMKTALGVDTGDIILQEETIIKSDETAGELFIRLSKIGASLIVKALDLLSQNKAQFIKQNDELSTHTKMLKKEDGLLNFNKNSNEIVNLIRGLNPWPIAHTFYDGKMLKIFKAEPVEITDNLTNVKSGTILNCSLKEGLIISTKDGAISVKELQLEGAKRLDIKQFLVGKNLQVGYEF